MDTFLGLLIVCGVIGLCVAFPVQMIAISATLYVLGKV